jgi:hypothetical protein
MTIKWSHSALKDFEGCQRRYHEVKVLKNYPFQDTQATIYGKEVHKAAEDYVRDGTPIPDAYAFMRPIVDKLLEKRGRKLPEYEMGVKHDLTPCDFKADDVWVRGIADLLIIDDDGLTAWVIDYKTGNDKYPDRDQLVLMSLMVFAHFPHIRQVNSALLFVVKNSMVKHKMSVDDRDFHWWRYRERVAKLSNCFSNNVWNPTSTPLCGWCPVKTCEFNPKH